MSLTKDTFFYSIANWSRRLIGLVTAPVLISYLTPSQFGYIALVNTIASFFSIIGMLAVVDQGLPRFFIDSNSDSEKNEYVSTAYTISAIGVCICASILIFSTPIIPYFFKFIDFPLLFTVLVAVICLSQSFQYVGSNMLKWTFQSNLFMKITFVQTLFCAIITIIGVVFLDWGTTEVLLVSAITALFSGFWSNFSVKAIIFPLTFSKNKLKNLAAYSWPLLGLNIFAYFSRSLDRIFLANLTSLNSVGIFSVSYTIASIFETLISGFFFAWGPHVLSTYKENSAPERYAKFFSFFTCLSIVSIIVFGLWGSSMVMLVRPDGAYQDIGVYIPWTISGIALYYLGGYFAPGPIIKKQTYWKFIAFFLAATCNAVLNYCLIPKFGILGAGIATTIAGLLAGSFNQIISSKLYYIPNRWISSFFFIIIITILVSLIQGTEFSILLNNFLSTPRIIFTFTLCCLAILPYRHEVKDIIFYLKKRGA